MFASACCLTGGAADEQVGQYEEAGVQPVSQFVRVGAGWARSRRADHDSARWQLCQ